MEYLDREGGKYLATKLKSYVDNKVTDLPSGTVDLTNYYTKEETDQLLANLPSGGTGTKGDKGDAGVGVSSIKSVNYELIITLTDGTVHNLGNIRGEKGAQGEKGAKGTNGVSPTVSVTETTNGHTVSITDVNGTQSFDVTNGTNGTDGVSPTVTVTKEGKIATITCTDVNGTTTATISDGADSQGGGSSSGGSAITYAYDTEIATGETWVDGKPIYLKVFHIDRLASQPKIIDYKEYYSQPKFAETIVSVVPTWRNGNNTSTGFMDDVVSSVSTSSSDVGSNVNNYILSKMMWCNAHNGDNFSIMIGRGNSRYTASCDVFVKYTKL